MTQNTVEGWGSLLTVLTDEELDQYRQVAQDQINRELRWGWLQAVGVVVGLCLLAGTAWQIVQGAVGSLRFIVPVGMAAGLGYWPYRSVKIRRLWRGHCEAVTKELERRHQG